MISPAELLFGPPAVSVPTSWAPAVLAAAGAAVIPHVGDAERNWLNKAPDFPRRSTLLAPMFRPQLTFRLKVIVLTSRVTPEPGAMTRSPLALEGIRTLLVPHMVSSTLPLL